jgi:hypothetical protein
MLGLVVNRGSMVKKSRFFSFLMDYERKEDEKKGNKISAGTIKRRLGRRNLITFHLSFRIFSWLKREDSLGRRVHP